MYMRSVNNPIKNVMRKLTDKLKVLKDAGKITYKQCMEITPQAESIPLLYALSKVHQNSKRPTIQAHCRLHRELHVQSC